jgi:hypothetical protein
MLPIAPLLTRHAAACLDPALDAPVDAVVSDGIATIVELIRLSIQAVVPAIEPIFAAV